MSTNGRSNMRSTSSMRNSTATTSAGCTSGNVIRKNVRQAPAPEGLIHDQGHAHTDQGLDDDRGHGEGGRVQKGAPEVRTRLTMEDVGVVLRRERGLAGDQAGVGVDSLGGLDERQ